MHNFIMEAMKRLASLFYFLNKSAYNAGSTLSVMCDTFTEHTL